MYGRERKISDLVQFKVEYSNYLQQGVKKLNFKKLNKLIKIKAELMNFKFFNGMRYLTIKVLKIINSEEKEFRKDKHEFIMKMRKHEKDIKLFITDLKRIHIDVQ